MILPGLLARLSTRPSLASRVLAPPLAQVVLGVERLGLAVPPRAPVVVGVWEADPDDPEAELLDEAEGWPEELAWPEDGGAREGLSVSPPSPPMSEVRPVRPVSLRREATAPTLSQPPPSAPRQPPTPLEFTLTPPVEGAIGDEEQRIDQPAPPPAAHLDAEGLGGEAADRLAQESPRVEPAAQAPRLRGLAAPDLALAERTIHVEQAPRSVPLQAPLPGQPQAQAPVEPPSRLTEPAPPPRPSRDDPPRGASGADVGERAAPPGAHVLDEAPTLDIQPSPPAARAAPPTNPPPPTEGDLPSSALQPAEAPAPAPPVARAPQPDAGVHATPEAPAPRRPRPERPPPRAPALEAPRLFEPVEGDRSPASWLARLRLAESAPEVPTEGPDETTTAPSPSPDSAAPEPSASHTAVRPLPAARVAAPQPARASQAQARPSSAGARAGPAPPPPPAVTVQAIASSARPWLEPIVGYDPTGTPVITGAGATEAARRLGADAFATQGVVVLAGAPQPSAPRTAGLLAHELTHLHPQRRALYAAPAPPSSDEEQVARAAEATATLRAARAAPTPHASPRPEPWGELPAPWEPLPDWLTAPRAADGPPTLAPPAPRPAIAARPPPPPPAPALAATDRPAAGPAPAIEAPQPAPDLDELARQVYGRLKRRLLLERRRGASEGSP